MCDHRNIIYLTDHQQWVEHFKQLITPTSVISSAATKESRFRYFKVASNFANMNVISLWSCELKD